jgi:hypothetical protein
VFIVAIVYFVINSFWKLLNTPSYAVNFSQAASFGIVTNISYRKYNSTKYICDSFKEFWDGSENSNIVASKTETTNAHQDIQAPRCSQRNCSDVIRQAAMVCLRGEYSA